MAPAALLEVGMHLHGKPGLGDEEFQQHRKLPLWRVPPEQRPHVIGRHRFGRVTIANSDAGAAAFTNQAFDEAHRAVQEILLSRGLS